MVQPLTRINLPLTWGKLSHRNTGKKKYFLESFFIYVFGSFKIIGNILKVITLIVTHLIFSDLEERVI